MFFNSRDICDAAEFTPILSVKISSFLELLLLFTANKCQIDMPDLPIINQGERAS